MRKQDPAQILAEHFHFQLNDELSAWFNTWWLDFNQTDLTGDFPPGILYKNHSAPGLMHPDLLPIATFSNGDRITVRFDELGNSRETGIWDCASRVYMPIATSLAESLVSYALTALTHELLFSATQNLSLATPALATTLSREYVRDLPALIQAEPSDAQDILALIIKEKSDRLSTHLLQEHASSQAPIARELQRLTQPNIAADYCDAVAEWLISATQGKRTEHKLKDRFRVLSQQADFLKLAYGILFVHPARSPAFDRLAQTLNQLGTAESTAAGLDPQQVAQAFATVTSVWKHLSKQNKSLPALKTLRAPKGIDLLKVLYTSGIAQTAVIEELKAIARNSSAVLNESDVFWISQLDGGHLSGFALALEQNSSDIDKESFARAYAEFLQKLDRHEVMLTQFVSKLSDFIPYVAGLSPEQQAHPFTQALLHTDPTRAVKDYWTKKAQEAKAEGQYASACRSFYYAAWDNPEAQAEAEMLQQFIACADQGSLQCWSKLGRWHQP